MERLRSKSILLTSYLEFLLNQRISSSFSIVTPQEKERRGHNFQSEFCSTGAHYVNGWLREGIVGDWREPDTFRVAPVPLYNSYQDVFRFAERFTAEIG